MNIEQGESLIRASRFDDTQLRAVNTYEPGYIKS
jgi:hypothetical protein